MHSPLQLLSQLLFVVQLFSFLEVDSTSCLTADNVQQAVLSWMALDKPEAAYTALQTHSLLTGQWAPPQQQQVFEQALGLLKSTTGAADAIVVLARQVCMVGVMGHMDQAPRQVHDLVLELLARNLSLHAYEASLARQLNPP